MPIFDIARQGMGAQGNDRDVRRYRVCTQVFQHLKAVDAGQINIHQNHIRKISARQRDTRIPIARIQHVDILIALEHLLDQHQVGRVVFHIKQGVPGAVFLIF